jgi:hypothetical protein
MKSAYREGDVYFRVTFPDAAQRIPQIQSFVYVGKNLSDEDAEDTWYFQFADSYAKHGSVVTSSKGAQDRRVSLATKKDLADMLDTEGVIEALRAALQKRETE